ncbi:type I-E CRISPR-associated protein Cse2/CasB [Leucobacter viscericola]|uniref:Type I-E CRISPR-associated protein Cse2/CasB n=1 Tax=Leucobacter viscericola TaxID=2714935 RepID=A0A6G7XGA9_9MICO|nr:type I-E CRISPR-associated protein Cse2/CasB [Leucobacter viscericola]QIK63595.1 type I-E CRISPR-associated protein Cse2/CasB [Leucobacter viscericola]
MSESVNSLHMLVGEVLRRRETDSRFRANVSRGLNPLTEQYAYPWVLPHVPSPYEQVVYLRVAGLVASYPNIPHSDKPTLGQSFRVLSEQRSGKRVDDETYQKHDAIAARLVSLQDQDLDGAVDTLRRLFDLNKKVQVPVNYFALARMLSRWGSGQSEASLAVRRRTLGDYYGAWSIKSFAPIESVDD